MSAAWIRQGQRPVAPLSRAQEEVWLAQAPLGCPDPYLLGEIVVLTGNLDMDRLVDAARWVAQRDETARWVVMEEADQFRLAECESARLFPEIMDVSRSAAALIAGWRWLSSWLSGPVLVLEQRAWALALVRLSPQRHLLACGAFTTPWRTVIPAAGGYGA